MKQKIGLLVVAFVATTACRAQVVIRGVEDAWHYADTHNITIKNNQYERSKAVAAQKQSLLAFLPTVSAQGTFTENTSLQTTLIPSAIFGGPDGTYRAVQFGQKYIYNGAITAQLDIVNLQTWYNEGIARTTTKLNEANLASSRRSVYQQIASQYYNCLLMAEAERLARSSRSIADSVYQSVKHKLDEGAIGKGNADIAELNRERAEKDWLSAVYQAQIARNTLKGLLDMAPTDSLAIDASLPSTAYSEPATIHFADDPNLSVAKLQYQLSLQQMNSAKASFFPTLTFQYNNSTQQNDNTFRPFQGGTQWYPANYYTLKASWALFTGGSRWLQAQKASIGAQQASLQLDNVAKQTAINDENLRLNAQKASAVLAKAKHIMELSLDNYQHVSNKNEAGIVPIDDRLTAFSDYINYQNQYLNSLSDLLVQLYNVKIRQQTF